MGEVGLGVEITDINDAVEKKHNQEDISEIKGDQVIQFVTFLSPNVGGQVASPLKKVTFSLTIPKKITLFESPGEAYLFVVGCFGLKVVKV